MAADGAGLLSDQPVEWTCDRGDKWELTNIVDAIGRFRAPMLRVPADIATRIMDAALDAVEMTAAGAKEQGAKRLADAVHLFRGEPL